LLKEHNESKIAIIQNSETPQVKRIEATPRRSERNKENYSLVQTDKVQTIGAYSCKLVMITTRNHEAQAWITKDLSIDLDAWFPNANQEEKEHRKLNQQFSKEGFVVELNIKNLSTGQEYWRKASIKTQNINQQVFEIPTGYRVTDLNNRNQTVQKFKSSANQLKTLRYKGKKSIKD